MADESRNAVANPSTDLVAGVDESDTSLLVVRWAARVAQQRNRGLRLVNGVDDIPEDYPHPAPTYEDVQRLVGARAQRLLDRAVAAAGEAAPGVAVRAVLRPERPAEALRAESADAALVVLGTPGLSRLGRFVLGSASLALAAHAECPVAFVRPHAAEDEPPSEGPVVLGVDATEAGEAAIGVAFDEAAWRGVPLVAVHAWHEAFFTAVFEEGGFAVDRAAYEEHQHELLAQRLAGRQERYPDVTVERHVVNERSAEALLDRADRAQLLVVGSRGRGALAGLALGSTSQSVISYALCPVIVARETPA